jgi:CBS domain-containing protein
MYVQSILTAKGNDVIAIEPTATIESAVKILAERRIGALLVLGPERRVIGIVSERDVVRAMAQSGAAALQLPVSQAMTRKVSTCTLADSVSSIMEQMTNGKFRHLPVVEQDQLLGIVSIGDIVKHRLMEMQQESEALRDYIQTA